MSSNDNEVIRNITSIGSLTKEIIAKVNEIIEKKETIKVTKNLALQIISKNQNNKIIEPVVNHFHKYDVAIRRLDLKYNPLLGLINNIGGNYSNLLDQANLLQHGITTSILILNSVIKLTKNHIKLYENETIETLKTEFASIGYFVLKQSIISGDAFISNPIISNESNDNVLCDNKEKGKTKKDDYADDYGYEDEYEDDLDQIPESKDSDKSMAVTVQFNYDENIPKEIGIEEAKRIFKEQNKNFIEEFHNRMKECENINKLIEKLEILINTLKSNEYKLLFKKEISNSENNHDWKVLLSNDKDNNSKKTFDIKDGINKLINRVSNDEIYLNDSVMIKMLNTSYSPNILQYYKNLLGEEKDDYKIKTSKLKSFISDKIDNNIGFMIASVCVEFEEYLNNSSFLNNSTENIKESINIIMTTINPLYECSLSFGLLYCFNEIKFKSSSLINNNNRDDINEIDQETVENETLSFKLKLLQLVANDMMDSFNSSTNITTPDPSLLLSFYLDSSEFNYTNLNVDQRLEMLNSLSNVLNIDKDYKMTLQVENDIRNNLILLQSLGGSSGSGTPSELTFDARRILGENDELSIFWIKSFGIECYDVSWSRFRMAFLNFYGNISDKDLKRLKSMLVDYRGNVTLETVVQFNKEFDGSITGTLKHLNRVSRLSKERPQSASQAHSKQNTIRIKDRSDLGKIKISPNMGMPNPKIAIPLAKYAKEPASTEVLDAVLLGDNRYIKGPYLSAMTNGKRGKTKDVLLKNIKMQEQFEEEQQKKYEENALTQIQKKQSKLRLYGIISNNETTD